MAIEKTLCIIKPNAITDNNTGNILARYESEGLRMAAAKFTHLSMTRFVSTLRCNFCFFCMIFYDA